MSKETVGWETITERLGTIGNQLKENKAAVAETTTNMETRAAELKETKEALTEEFALLKESYDSRSAEIVTLTENFNKLQESVDKQILSIENAENRNAESDIEELITRSLDIDDMRNSAGVTNRSEYEAYKKDPKGYRPKLDIQLTQESLGMTTRNTVINDGAAAAYPKGNMAPLRAPLGYPTFNVNVSQYFSNITGSDVSLPFLRFTGSSGRATVVGVGEEKSKITNTFVPDRKDAKKIAGVIYCPEEYLADIPVLGQFLQSRLRYEVQLTKQDQLLGGSDVGNNLEGLKTGGTTASVVGTGMEGAIAANKTVTDLDVLLATTGVFMDRGFMPTVIMINSLKLQMIRMLKDSDESFQFPGLIFQNGQVTLGGIPLVAANSLTFDYDDFIIADSRLSGYIYNRSDVSLRTYDQNRDQAEYNMITMIAEVRLMQIIERPDAILVGSFNTLKGEIQAA